jgi:predicted Zn-dependent peptidase
MTRLAKSEIYFGRFVTLDELVTNINSVTTDDLLKFSESFFDPTLFSETVLLPETR